jgi:hypothetical protein
MLKIEKTEVFGWEAAIRGMRNPKNSWDKSDSEWEFVEDPAIINPNDEVKFVLGDNDHKLMRTLSDAGTDHGKFLRFLTVQVDITAPFYWWKEFKTYRKNRKFMDDGDEFLDPEEFEMFIETNACSTMHKIHAKEFTLDDFSHEHLEGRALNTLEEVIEDLNYYREKYVECAEALKYNNFETWSDGMACKTAQKEYWWQMIQLLPSSYNQKRTVQLNYQVSKAMYHARKNHKLDEWREFCAWCETLPYFKEICL